MASGEASPDAVAEAAAAAEAALAVAVAAEAAEAVVAAEEAAAASAAEGVDVVAADGPPEAPVAGDLDEILPEDEDDAAACEGGDEVPPELDEGDDALRGEEDDEEGGEGGEEEAAVVDEEVEPQAPKQVVKRHSDSEPELDDEMKEAVEGVLRLKRLLSREFDNDERAKKRTKRDMDQRSAAHDVKVSQLLNKWGLAADSMTRHVLENLSFAELQYLITSNYSPDTHNMWKSPAELLQTHSNQVRESRGPGGGPLDVVSAFKFKWKLDILQEKLLRSLGHKDLRYVLRHFDGRRSLIEVVDAARRSEPPEDEISTAAVPTAPGVQGMGRFTRLELIDPLADCAIFGDANLTFAVNLAVHRKALGHVGRVIATTFENLETLQERYKEIDETIQRLEELYSEVHHGVDCTRIAIDSRFDGLRGSLGAVYYNYPHAGAVGGFFDGHPVVNWRHENLMRLFFRALRSFVKPGGSVKVASNSGAVGVRFSYIVGAATQNEFEHVETMPFQQWALHRYGRSYGDRRDTYKRPGEGEQYNAQRADSDMVYCFEYKPSGNPIPRQQIRLPPTYKTMLGCTDGALGERQGEAKKKLANELFRRFMSECSGIHVG